MTRKINHNSSIDLCYKNTCVKAYGRNANMIAEAATAMLVLFGIAALINAVK